MILIFFKYFVIYICSFYTSRKISKTHFCISNNILLSIGLAMLNALASEQLPNQPYFLSILFFIFINYIFFQNFQCALISSLLSYALIFSINTTITIIIASILSFFRSIVSIRAIYLLTPMTCILTPIITHKILSIRRFKSGIPFVSNLKISILGTSLAICIIILSITIYSLPSEFSLYSVALQLLACLLLIPFIAWWRSQLTKSYRQYLKDAETQELRAKVEQLTADNQHLSQIVHKDNKLITAMTSSVLTFVEEIPDYSPKHLSAYSRTLHQELLSLSTHRQDSLSRLSGAVTGQFHTGYMMLDSVLNLQSKQAREYNIAFSVESNDDFFTKIFLTIDEEQLTHIVADLVQNAIIATKDAPYKSVDIAFVTGPQAPSIQISDTGLPFPTVVLNSLGQERCSQHLHDGGSGIGLMDIWTLKNTARATLLIEEFPDGAKFTKRIHLIFDKKNRYIIISDRKDELSSQLHRPDVILLSSSH